MSSSVEEFVIIVRALGTNLKFPVVTFTVQVKLQMFGVKGQSTNDVNGAYAIYFTLNSAKISKLTFIIINRWGSLGKCRVFLILVRLPQPVVLLYKGYLKSQSSSQ